MHTRQFSVPIGSRKVKPSRAYRSLLLVAGLLSVVQGCSGIEEFPLGQISGSVTCEGKPVPKAIVYFEPIRTGESAQVGQQGFGLTDENGKFAISTYGENDGAVIGKHLVRVGRSETTPACSCALVADNVLQEVEVKSGPNEFGERPCCRSWSRRTCTTVSLRDQCP